MRSACLGLVMGALAVMSAGCPAVRSAVNTSPDLRWWMFSNFGASKICPEMLKRGVPLKLPQLGNASVGRFFPTTCVVQVDDARKAIVMTAAGTGYATLPVARRVGFSGEHGGRVPPRLPARVRRDVRLGQVQPLRHAAGHARHRRGEPGGQPRDAHPRRRRRDVDRNGIVASEIGRGFTLVRQDDGDDFTLGHLEPPDKPKRQFKSGDSHVVLGSDLTQVNGQSRDFLGPFEVPDKNAALYFHAKVDGTPLVYAVVDRSVGDAWRHAYEQAQPMAAPPGALISQHPCDRSRCAGAR